MTEVPETLRESLAGRYDLQHEIGSGGMAVVYLARDGKHDREVAVKVLKPELAAAVGAERFLREIKITARLNHPHILPLLDSGEAGGFLYYVMPHVSGGSLRRILKREAILAVDAAVRITEQVASALDHAHRIGGSRGPVPRRICGTPQEPRQAAGQGRASAHQGAGHATGRPVCDTRGVRS